MEVSPRVEKGTGMTRKELGPLDFPLKECSSTSGRIGEGTEMLLKRRCRKVHQDH